jgi:acetolactate synthase-1/3 small subunit
MIEITGVESKVEGLLQMLGEKEGRILEVCRSGKMTMRRGEHTSGVLKAMDRSADEAAESEGAGTVSQKK